MPSRPKSAFATRALMVAHHALCALMARVDLSSSSGSASISAAPNSGVGQGKWWSNYFNGSGSMPQTIDYNIDETGRFQFKKFKIYFLKNKTSKIEQ
jgi:hypothetical protein